MNVNTDFTLKAVMDTHALAWEPSPMAGVERQPLDRVGDEVARASSIVRYAAGSGYSAHTHGGGEEILVLDGIFSDEQYAARCHRKMTILLPSLFEHLNPLSTKEALLLEKQIAETFVLNGIRTEGGH